MAAIPVTVFRPAAAWVVNATQLVITIPAAEVLTIHRLELIGAEQAAAAMLRVGLYEWSGATGGSPSNAEVAVHGLLDESVPAGWLFQWGYSTAGSVGTKRQELTLQPFGGVDSWPPPGFPFTRHNKTAAAIQMAIVGVSGTSQAALRLALTLGA